MTYQILKKYFAGVYIVIEYIERWTWIGSKWGLKAGELLGIHSFNWGYENKECNIIGCELG